MNSEQINPQRGGMPRPDADEKPTDPDVAATTLDSGSIGIGLGGRDNGHENGEKDASTPDGRVAAQDREDEAAERNNRSSGDADPLT